MSWSYHPYPLGDAATPLPSPVRVTLANRANRQGAFDTRRRAMARYTVPVVSAPLAPLGGILIQYVQPPRQAVRFTRYKLGPPRVVTPAATAIFFGPKVVQARRVPYRRPMYVLGMPVVVTQDAQYGPDAHLTYSRRGAPKSVLRAPVVVTAAAVSEPAPPIKVTLARIKPRPTQYRLGQPIVVYVESIGYGPGVRLAPQSRGTPKSILRPPAVVTPERTDIFFGPRVTLARIRPPRTVARLLPVPAAFRPVGQLAVHLAADSPRGKAKPRLYAPTVVAPVLARPTLVHLAYSSRGIPKSRLSAPTVVAPVLARAILVKLVRIRPVRTTYVLRRPTDLVDQQDVGYVRVHLAYSLRGKPKSRLAPPTVVQAFRIPTVAVTLAPSSRGAPKSRLLPVPEAFRPVGFAIAVHLTYSSRGKPKSLLRKPSVVGGSIAYGGPRVRLTNPLDRVPATISRLAPPTVVTSGVVVVYFGPKVTLARIRPVKTRARLLTVPAAFQPVGSVAITLAPQKRGTPKSELRPPVVIDLSPQVYSLTVELAPSFRGKPKSILRRPVDLVDRDDLGFVRVHLAYSVRGKPKSILRRPVVIDLRPQTRFISVTLAPSRFPKPKSILRPDSKFAPVPQGDFTILVKLAPQTRGKPKSELRPPPAVGAGIYFRGIRVRLAPSRFPRPKSVLRKPTVVQTFRVPVVSINLVRIRPVAVHPELRPPTDLSDRQDLGSVRVHLAPSRFPVPKSRLEPPTVIGRFVAPPTQVALAPQRRGVPRSLLKPPTVVGAGVAFYGPSVTLVRIRPVRTLWVLRPPTVRIEQCYGDVVGFDFAPEVCGSDEAATVTGTTSSANAVSGSDSAATATGASAPGGSVTGGDEKREGC